MPNLRINPVKLFRYGDLIAAFTELKYAFMWPVPVCKNEG